MHRLCGFSHIAGERAPFTVLCLDTIMTPCRGVVVLRSQVSVADGQAIIRQGEEGDTFHVIDAGEVSCTVSGQHCNTRGMSHRWRGFQHRGSGCCCKGGTQRG